MSDVIRVGGWEEDKARIEQQAEANKPLSVSGKEVIPTEKIEIGVALVEPTPVVPTVPTV